LGSSKSTGVAFILEVAQGIESLFVEEGDPVADRARADVKYTFAGGEPDGVINIEEMTMVLCGKRTPVSCRYGASSRSVIFRSCAGVAGISPWPWAELG
jgi:hypothetical protein